uniref:XNP-1-like n=1 Tax=Oryza rufipogon TaxID=4529 RepID=A0A0E0RBZ4_ORYRU|nr:XNP-1-like [Oryza rufipogon]
MSQRIPTRANLALAALLIVLTVATTTVPLASAKCIAKNKPEGEEGEPGGAGAAEAHASPEKKPGSTGGLSTMSVGESVPEIKKDSSDDGATVNESKKPKSSGGLTTLSVDDSQAEPADSIAEPMEDGTDDGEDESEKKKKKKKKKSKSKSSDDDDDDAKKKSKKKPKNSDDDEDDKKKSKKKPKNPDDDEDDKKKSKKKSSDEDNDGAKKKKKKKSKGKSSDEEDDEKPTKKSKSKSKSSSSDEEDEKKSKSESQAAAKPKEEDEEGGSASASASASTSAPKNEHHSGTMSLPDPDMIAQPVMQALNPVVKALCGKTDHADLCESSIGQLPQQPPAQLDDIGVLRLSMNALRAKVQEAISVATNRMGEASGDEVSKDAMGDCLQMYDDMKSNLDSADAALKKGDKDTAHTMLDSARTDVDTCEDGFSEREGLKPIMGDLDKILAELSSNTIAIASAIIE